MNLLGGSIYVDESRLISYPFPRSDLRWIHLLFDRLSQATLVGFIKIWNETSAFSPVTEVENNLLDTSISGTIAQVKDSQEFLQSLGERSSADKSQGFKNLVGLTALMLERLSHLQKETLAFRK